LAGRRGSACCEQQCDQAQAGRLAEAMRATDTARLDEYLGVFLTDAKTQRASVTDQ